MTTSAPRRALGGLIVTAVLLAAPAPQAAAQVPGSLDISVFARVGDPGQPEGVAIGPRGRRVFVGTNQQGHGDADAPSVVFSYSNAGELLRTFELQGQDLSDDHGIQSLAFDRKGRLYILDRSASPRVVKLNRRTGRQRTYATFSDVPSCGLLGGSGQCSDTLGDFDVAPNTMAFAPDGTLYVTDIQQALIWRIPPGGGEAEVWFTDRRLENLFGPNGIQFMGDGRTLLFASSASSPITGDPTSGALYRLAVNPDGSPGQLESFWKSRPFDGPDGFAIAASGNVYAMLAAANQVAVISPQGEELARVPPGPAENSQEEIPLDGPASAAFLDQRLLFTNQSFPAGNPNSWAVLELAAGEPGLPLFRPGKPKKKNKH